MADRSILLEVPGYLYDQLPGFPKVILGYEVVRSWIPVEYDKYFCEIQLPSIEAGYNLRLDLPPEVVFAGRVDG